MVKPRVFVTRIIAEGGLRLLRDTCDMDLWEGALPPPHDVLLARAHDCDGVLSLLTDRIDGDFLDHCPQVRVVSNLAVGFDNIDVPAATQRGVLVGNTPGVLTETTADCAFALLMAAARRLPEGIAYVRDGQWQTWEPLGLLGQDVHHATLGLLGLGRIGTEMAQRALGFAMRVLYTSPTRHPDIEARLDLEYVAFTELLRQADFLSIHAPLTPATRGLIGTDALRQMKPTAIVINTARGPIIDTDALVAALQAGVIGGAALDVTDPEPLPADHPLARLRNCIVVPHIASASERTRARMAEIAATNLLAGLRGTALSAGLNPTAADQGRQALPRRYEM